METGSVDENDMSQTWFCFEIRHDGGNSFGIIRPLSALSDGHFETFFKFKLINDSDYSQTQYSNDLSLSRYTDPRESGPKLVLRPATEAEIKEWKLNYIFDLIYYEV